jgi:hypothetical protein
VIGGLLGTLAEVLPQQQAESFVQAALARGEGLDIRLRATFQKLPRPWSAPFAGEVLRRLHARLRELSKQQNIGNPQEAWLAVLTEIATAIPPARFDEALAIQSIVAQDDPSATETWWQRRIADHADLVRTRQRLMEEIPL